ncbi:Sorting nexin-41 [Schizosaccharomyces pombe]
MDFFEDNNPFSGSDNRSASSAVNVEPKVEPSQHQGSSSVKENAISQPNESFQSRNMFFQKDVDSVVDSALDPNGITITGAMKAESGSHIVYIIKLQDSEIHHRYSEFASLRVQLSRLYPTCLVPPLPDKHKIMDYLINVTKNQRMSRMLEERKRLLQLFLRRVAQHPILGLSEVFRKFLSRHVSWKEVLHSPPISCLPKDLLKAPPADPSSKENAELYKELPIPSKTLVPRDNYDDVGKKFLMLEDTLQQYSIVAQEESNLFNQIVLSNSKYCLAHSTLGAMFNALSLSESGKLLTALEKVGQANDHTCLASIDFMHNFVIAVIEPLQELSKDAKNMRHIFIFRKMKFIQQVMVEELLTRKKSFLHLLERRERHAARLQQAIGEVDGDVILNRESEATLGVNNAQTSRSTIPEEDPLFNDEESNEPSVPLMGTDQPLENYHDGNGEQTEECLRDLRHNQSQDFETVSQDTSLTSVTVLPRTIRDVFDRIRFVLNGLTDNNVEVSRHNNIGRTAESVTHLTDMLLITTKDVAFVTDRVNFEFQRYQDTHRQDLNRILNRLTDSHIDWANRNLRIWNSVQESLKTYVS